MTVYIHAAAWERTTAESAQKILDDFAAGGVYDSVDDIPSVKQWNDFFKTTGGKGVLDLHHSVEKYIQELLGIPETLWDSCPGIPLPRNKAILDQLNAPFATEPARQLRAIHKGMKDGGISGILQSRIPVKNNTMTRQQILDTFHQIHTDPSLPEFNNVWRAARDYLRKMQQQGHLEPTLSIPD